LLGACADREQQADSGPQPFLIKQQSLRHTYRFYQTPLPAALHKKRIMAGFLACSPWLAAFPMLIDKRNQLISGMK
jgi:hypothetical protein